MHKYAFIRIYSCVVCLSMHKLKYAMQINYAKIMLIKMCKICTKYAANMQETCTEMQVRNMQHMCITSPNMQNIQTLQTLQCTHLQIICTNMHKYAFQNMHNIHFHLLVYADI